jgi:hypothetical protein
MRRVLTIMLVVAVATLLSATLAAAAGASGGPTVKAKGAAYIHWYQAKQHIGRHGTVGGPVKATIYEKRVSGHPTFINIGRDYPNKARFTVVIWEKYRQAFPFRPEAKYRGRTLLVTGKIRWFEGCAEMFVRSPAAIKIIR